MTFNADAKPGEFPIEYFNYPEYTDKSASEKMDDLWAACTLDSEPEPFYWVEWGTLFNQDMRHSFANGDEMPEGNLKLAHTQGAVAKVSWEPIGDAGGYTGMLGNEGSKNVLMRLSETGMLHEESGGLTPSVAFKFLRDGTFSDNIVAMPSFEGSGSWNFFEKPMLTRVAAFGEDTCPDKTLKKLLGGGSRFPFSCGYSQLTIHKEDGSDLQD